MSNQLQTPWGAGVGLRLPHLAEVVATRPSAAWFEIHPENCLANPHAAELLDEIAQHYPISVHTVGVSIGSASGIDHAHLKRVRTLVDRINPALVSGHLAWSTHRGEFLNDLLPMPYDDESLEVLVRHVKEVQDGLGRPYLVENPSSYIGFGASTMNEAQFLSELVARTGCKLLCDVSNVYLSGHNMGYDPLTYLKGLPADAVGELHLGGFAIERDDAADEDVLIDTHACRIDDAAWRLYAEAIRLFGPTPTLIEWDSDIPAFDILIEEAATANRIAASVEYDHVAC